MAIKRKDIDDFKVLFLYEKEKWALQRIADYFDTNTSVIYYRLHPEKQKEHSRRNRESEKRRKYMKKYMKEWDKSEKGRKYKEAYSNSKKGRTSKMAWRKSEVGKNYMRIYMKAWRNSEKGGAYFKAWRDSEEGKIYLKTWRQSEEGKKCMRRANSRRRELGFIPLNESFEGCEMHHINKDCVAYIPIEVHKTVYHNIWTGKGMEEINEKTFEFLNGGEEVYRKKGSE